MYLYQVQRMMQRVWTAPVQKLAGPPRPLGALATFALESDACVAQWKPMLQLG